MRGGGGQWCSEEATRRGEGDLFDFVAAVEGDLLRVGDNAAVDEAQIALQAGLLRHHPPERWRGPPQDPRRQIFRCRADSDCDMCPALSLSLSLPLSLSMSLSLSLSVSLTLCLTCTETDTDDGNGEDGRRDVVHGALLLAEVQQPQLTGHQHHVQQRLAQLRVDVRQHAAEPGNILERTSTREEAWRREDVPL